MNISLTSKKRNKNVWPQRKQKRENNKAKIFKVMNQMVAEVCEYTKNHLTTYFKMVNFWYM